MLPKIGQTVKIILDSHTHSFLGCLGKVTAIGKPRKGLDSRRGINGITVTFDPPIRRDYGGSVTIATFHDWEVEVV